MAKDCWEKHPDKKPKPKAKSKSTNPKGKGDKDKKSGGRGKGGRKAKGRGRGNKFRNVEGEEEDEEQDEDYDDEEHPEPEGEDPSGSVNQINQMTMCVRRKPVTVAASSSSTERVYSEQHRVDEINLAEKFQSIGVGDPKRRWLVDSGATCHIISERWLSHYKVVYKYEVGIPVLKGAGDNVLPTRGMVDLECKIGKRLEVLVLKNPGKSSRKGNGPQDMEIDHVGTVQSSLSSKACQTKAVVTEVDLEHKKPVETLEGKREISCIPHVSAAENVGHFKNMRRECQGKSFDGLGPFSYVCRMMRFSEPNTNEFYHNNQRLRHHKVPIHHGDFFACYERSDSNTPFQADRIETDVAQGWVANAPISVRGEAAGSTALAPSVAEAADTAQDDGSPAFEQTGDPLLLIGRDSGRRRGRFS